MVELGEAINREGDQYEEQTRHKQNRHLIWMITYSISGLEFLLFSSFADEISSNEKGLVVTEEDIDGGGVSGGRRSQGKMIDFFVNMFC